MHDKNVDIPRHNELGSFHRLALIRPSKYNEKCHIVCKTFLENFLY